MNKLVYGSPLNTVFSSEEIALGGLGDEIRELLVRDVTIGKLTAVDADATLYSILEDMTPNVGKLTESGLETINRAGDEVEERSRFVSGLTAQALQNCEGVDLTNRGFNAHAKVQS